MKRIITATKRYIVVFALVLAAVAWVLVMGSRPVSSERTRMRVVIAEGTPASRIASALQDKGLIRSSFVFSLTCRVSGVSSKLKPGVYEFSRAMSLSEIIHHLVNGDTLDSWVTIPEGFTVRQIADLLAGRQLVNRDSFVSLSIDQGSEFAKYAFLDGDSLEGYLFPDTYLVERGSDLGSIITKMLDAFDRKVAHPCRADVERVCRARFHEGDEPFSEEMRQVLTMASLVEREAKIPKDRPLIAAVLWNRLKKNMRLEIDASVTYRPGESKHNKGRVFYADLESDSPYNTYKRPGLPPGPICNPGLASINAVLNPAPVDYLYYVARPDGSHAFSRTFKEHLAAKAKAQLAGKNGKL